jgi:hypothetical protein
MKTTHKASTAPKASAKRAAAKKAVIPAVKPTKKPAKTGKPVGKRSAAPQRTAEVAVEITHEEIATRAYFIYISTGCPEGQEMQHWLEAETQLTRC